MFDFGFFGRIAGRYWRVIAEMWSYIRRGNLFVKLLGLPVFLAYAPFLLLAGASFALLIPFDLLAAAIEVMRSSLLRFYGQMSRASGDNFLGFVLLPGLLLALAPILLLIVIVPKVGGLMDDRW